MDFKHKSPQNFQNGNGYMDQRSAPLHHHRSPYSEMSTNQSLLHHINTASKHQEQHPMELAQDFQSQHQKYQQQTMFVKNHYHSPKSRHLRRRARSESLCLSPSRSPQHYHNQNYQQYPERYGVKSHGHNSYTKERHQEIDQWRSHRREEQVSKCREEQVSKYREYELQNLDGYKHRFHNLQIDGKGMQYEEMEAVPTMDEIDSYNQWHQQRRLRASSESASHDYYYRDSYLELEEYRAKRTREAAVSPAKERRSSQSHMTNPKNNYSVLVNNTSHYRYSPKSKVRSHYTGHKAVARVSSPLHKARIQMWKNQAGSPTSTSIPSSIGSNSTPETPQLDDEDSDIEDDDDEEPPGPCVDQPDDMSDPEDNYETSLSISSSERSLAKPAPTTNTDCVLGGRVLSAPFSPSLFPFVPPYITFATFEEKGPEIPAIIHKQLKWKLTTITPLLVRKVLLNTGFRLMKSE